MAPAKMTKLRRYLDEILAKGFIRMSTSSWGALVLFIKEAYGTLRLCIDNKKLN